jgi:hypothetical protein
VYPKRDDVFLWNFTSGCYSILYKHNKACANKQENWNSCWKFTKKCVNNQLGKWIDYVPTKEFVFNHVIHNQMPFEIIIGKSFHGTNFLCDVSISNLMLMEVHVKKWQKKFHKC